MAETPCSGRTNLINKDEMTSLDVDIENQEEDADEEERFTNELTLTQSSIGLTIYIETLTGTTFEIQVFPSDTINDIKMKLQESQGIPVKEQHLIWKSQELRNELTVEQYGINFGMILKLVLRIRGGPIAKSPSFIFDQQDDCFNLTASSDSSDLDIGSRPVTVLIYQDKEDQEESMFTVRHIRYYEIQNQQQQQDDDEINRNSILSRSIFDDQTKFKNLENEKNNEKEKLTERDIENRITKQKMKEIQEKMQKLYLQKNMNKEKEIEDDDKVKFGNLNSKLKEQNKNNNGFFVKLPSLTNFEGSTKDNQLNKSEKTSGTSSVVHLPSIQQQQKPPNNNRNFLMQSSSLNGNPSKTNSEFLKFELQQQHNSKEGRKQKEEQNKVKSKVKVEKEEENEKINYSRKFCSRKRSYFKRSSFNEFTSLSNLSDLNGYGYANSFVNANSDAKANSIIGNAVVDHVKHHTEPSSGTILTQEDINFKEKRPKTVPIYEKIDFTLIHLRNEKISIEMLYNQYKVQQKESLDYNNFKTLSSSSSSMKNMPSSKLPESNGRLPQLKSRKSNKIRCFQCKKRLNISSNYKCRCGGVFCSVHRYSEAHICSYDYKAEGKKLIQLTSSLINDARFPKI